MSYCAYALTRRLSELTDEEVNDVLNKQPYACVSNI